MLGESSSKIDILLFPFFFPFVFFVVFDVDASSLATVTESENKNTTIMRYSTILYRSQLD